MEGDSVGCFKEYYFFTFKLALSLYICSLYGGARFVGLLNTATKDLLYPGLIHVRIAFQIYYDAQFERKRDRFRNLQVVKAQAVVASPSSRTPYTDSLS